jgi:hypothetical protein
MVRYITILRTVGSGAVGSHTFVAPCQEVAICPVPSVAVKMEPPACMERAVGEPLVQR